MDSTKYKRLEFVYSNTKVNTIVKDISIDPTDGIDITVRNLNRIEGEFGFIYNSNAHLLFGFRNNNNNNTALRVYIASTEKNLVTDINDKKFNVTCSNLSEGEYYINGKLIDTIPYTGEKFIGNISGFQNSSNIVFYDYIVRDNSGNMKYHFIPARQISDNKIGLYDDINSIFYPISNASYGDVDDFSTYTSIQIPEGEVSKIEDKDGNILWSKKS